MRKLSFAYNIIFLKNLRKPVEHFEIQKVLKYRINIKLRPFQYADYQLNRIKSMLWIPVKIIKI